MAMMTLVLADSGFGKTYSLRNFDPQTVALVRCISKALPFRSGGWKEHGRIENGQRVPGNMFTIDFWGDIVTVIHKMAASNRRVLIIDDFQAVMQHENLGRAYETGYQKFTEMADHVMQIINAAAALPDDFRVYFLAHTDGSEGTVRMKTIGKMLNEKLTPEGYFTIVLRVVKRDGQHLFLLKGEDNDTVKCPPDLFPGLTTMENDLAAVDAAIVKFQTEY